MGTRDEPGGAYDDTSASVLDFHHSMLSDSLRTETFMKAILATVKPGETVVDIGAGTGVLSLFAAMAGASRVYAIEQGEVAELARRIVARNGLADRITVIELHSSEVELPERADVLITETIGNAGLDEGIVAWVADARQRLLKPGARIIPARLTVEAALVEVARDYAEVDRWSRPLLGLDFSPLRETTLNNILWGEFNPVHLVSPPARMLDLGVGTSQTRFNVTRQLVPQRDGVVHGLGVWFDAELYPGLHLSNRPPSPVPSWQQGFLPLRQPVPVQAAQTVAVRLQVSGGGRDWRWSVGRQGAEQATGRGRLGGRPVAHEE